MGSNECSGLYFSSFSSCGTTPGQSELRNCTFVSHYFLRDIMSANSFLVFTVCNGAAAISVHLVKELTMTRTYFSDVARGPNPLAWVLLNNTLANPICQKADVSDTVTLSLLGNTWEQQPVDGSYDMGHCSALHNLDHNWSVILLVVWLGVKCHFLRYWINSANMGSFSCWFLTFTGSRSHGYSVTVKGLGKLLLVR